MIETALSLMVLTVVALLAGALFLWRRGAARKQVILMLVLATVISVNVAIWTVPDRNGNAPLSEQPQ